MKLLNCMECHDVRAIGAVIEVVCLCGKSRAHCVGDEVTVEYSGASARILGMRNPDYLSAQPGRDYNWWVFMFSSPSIRRVDAPSAEAGLTSEIKAAEARLRALKRSCTHYFKEDSESARCTACGEYFGWRCPDSPDRVCHYYTGNGSVRLLDGSFVSAPAGHDCEFETSDSCVFCGDPEERL